MRKRHHPALFTLLGAGLLAIGCADDPAAPGPAPGAVAYDLLWDRFDSIYPYFVHKQVDWGDGRTELRDRAAAAGTASELVPVLLDAVAPLRDVHVRFRRPDGSGLPSYVPEREPNWDQALWQLYLDRLDWHQGDSNWGWGRVDGVGYLAVGAWNTSQVRIADLDAALEQLRDTRALVLDVRMNEGGNDALALQLAGRFATEPTPFAMVRYRDGPAHSDLSPWIRRELEPRGPWSYDGDVYLLVGPRCFSSNESFIAAMGELAGVTTVGDTTGGSSGNPESFDLVLDERATGWAYTVPRWILALIDGTIVEWNGIPPDVVVPFGEAEAEGADPVLEWAFDRAGSPVPPPTPRRAVAK